MAAGSNDAAAFSADVGVAYDDLLVPMLFEPYASDAVDRLLAALEPGAAHVLEIACGTGAVTRALAARLSEEVAITATDLNPGMLATAQRVGAHRPVTWRQADVMALPFSDAGFDAAVCQFGIMFFPDRALAAREIRRVLVSNGRLVVSSWDTAATNGFADAVATAIGDGHAGMFLRRTPHGYTDPDRMVSDLEAGGFTDVTVTPVELVSTAPTARDVALAYCLGTPMREMVDPADRERTVDAVTAEIERRYGDARPAAPMRALVAEAVAP